MQTLTDFGTLSSQFKPFELLIAPNQLYEVIKVLQNNKLVENGDQFNQNLFLASPVKFSKCD